MPWLRETGTCRELGISISMAIPAAAATSSLVQADAGVRTVEHEVTGRSHHAEQVEGVERLAEVAHAGDVHVRDQHQVGGLLQRGQGVLPEAGGRVDHHIAELGGQHADDGGGGRDGDALPFRRFVGGAQDVEPGLVAGEEDLEGGGVQVGERRDGVRHGVLRRQHQGVGGVAELEVQVDQHGLAGSAHRQPHGQVGAQDRLAAASLRRDHGDHPGPGRLGGDAPGRRPLASDLEGPFEMGAQLVVGAPGSDDPADPGGQRPPPGVRPRIGDDQHADRRVEAIEAMGPFEGVILAQARAEDHHRRGAVGHRLQSVRVGEGSLPALHGVGEGPRQHVAHPLLEGGIDGGDDDEAHWAS